VGGFMIEGGLDECVSLGDGGLDVVDEARCLAGFMDDT